MNRRWTPEEEEALREGWGGYGGVRPLAQKMGRSVNAIRIRAQRMGLGPWADAGEYVTLHQIVVALYGQPKGMTYETQRLKALGIPVKRHKVIDCRFDTVKLSDFWRWAKDHRNDLDFSRLEKHALGREPEWAKEKRRIDILNRKHQHPKKVPWTLHEDALLRQKCMDGTTWAELEASFQRTSAAIRRRIYDLYLPIPKRDYQPRYSWTERDMTLVADLRDAGYSIDYIARLMGRTAQSIRGKLEWLDKKKVMIQ